MTGFGRAILCAIGALCFCRSAGSQTIPKYKNLDLSQDLAFHLKPDDKEFHERFCPSDRCVCKSDIQYVRITSESQGVRLINQRLRADAEKARCVYLQAVASMEQEVTHLSAHVVSVVELAESLNIGAQGSCHQSVAVHTYELATAKEYLLGDIINPSSLSKLRETLPASIAAEHDRQDHEVDYEQWKANPPAGRKDGYKPYVEPAEDFARDVETGRRKVDSLSDRDLLRAPIFIKNTHLFININDYIFGCAGGTFHPAEIPASMITLPSIQRELHKP